MNDTSAKIRGVMEEMMKNKSGVERLKMGADMFDMAKKIVASSVPDCSDTDLCLLFFDRFYGRDFSAQIKKKIERHLRLNAQNALSH